MVKNLSNISRFRRITNEENNVRRSVMFSKSTKEKVLILRNNLTQKYEKENIAVKISPKLPSFISPFKEKGKIIFTKRRKIIKDTINIIL